MATPADVDRALHALVDKMRDAEIDPSLDLPARRTLACRVRDLDMAYEVELSAGSVERFEKVTGEATGDVTITVGSDDLIALTEGRLNVAMAMLTGKLRVQASVEDLMLLRKLFT